MDIKMILFNKIKIKKKSIKIIYINKQSKNDLQINILNIIIKEVKIIMNLCTKDIKNFILKHKKFIMLISINKNNFYN